eukprot:928302-Amphidinium_carterae.1
MCLPELKIGDDSILSRVIDTDLAAEHRDTCSAEQLYMAPLHALDYPVTTALSLRSTDAVPPLLGPSHADSSWLLVVQWWGALFQASRRALQRRDEVPEVPCSAGGSAPKERPNDSVMADT